MTSLTRSSYINVIKTDIKTLCKNFVPIVYQVPVMMQAGGGDEQIALDFFSPCTMEKYLIHSEEHFINGSLNPTDQKSIISSQYYHEGTSFSELNYVTRSQDKLSFPSAELQLISAENIIEEDEDDEYNLPTETYFTLQVEEYLKNFLRQTHKINSIDNFDEYLRNIIWLNFLNRNHLRHEDSDASEPDVNLSMEINNVERDYSHETMTGSHYESVPDLLKKAYCILKKIQNNKTKMFNDSIFEKFHEH